MILQPAPHVADQLPEQLRQQGYAVLGPPGVCELADCRLDDLLAWRPSWNDLPPDDYLKDGGHYRRRRHSCFMVNGRAVTQAPHRAHWQPVEYNALHGGMQRWFEPISPAVVQSPAWQRLLVAMGHAALGAQGRSALVRGGASVPHRHRGRHRPADTGRRAPRRGGPGGGVPGEPPGHQGRRDPGVRGQGPGGPALHARPIRGACCCSTTSG